MHSQEVRNNVFQFLVANRRERLGLWVSVLLLTTQSELLR